MARVITTPEADEQILAIDDWWREHRRAAPGLFTNELSIAFEQLAHAPFGRRLHPNPDVPGLRRLLLRATRYHVYYVGSEETVLVLAVWSAVRGIGPNLKGFYGLR